MTKANKFTDGPQGTPQSLSQALDHVAQALGQTWTPEQKQIARMHLRDFMAQRFTAAMHRHEDAEAILKALFLELFG